MCNSWILFVAEINPQGGCDIKPDYGDVYNLFSLIETISCMIIPSIFIVFSNIFVVLRLREHLKQIPSSPTVSFNTADTVYSTGPTQTIKSTKVSKFVPLIIFIKLLIFTGQVCADSVVDFH